MSIRTIIVDDEPLARERVRSLLQAEFDVDIVDECANGNEAVQSIRKHEPDLVFLDVQMPGMDGFEVLRSLGRQSIPAVVFVTAYDQHALKAFDVHALDYLLKPFKPARFKETVERVRQMLKNRAGGNLPKGLLDLLEATKPTETLSRIAVKSGERTIFVKTDQIDYCEAAGNYVVLHAGKENHVVRETLTNLEATLDKKKFIRINRSTLVNVDQIKEVQPLFKGEHAVLLHNGKQLSLTRGVRELEDLLRFS